jgi:hypothetical protein
VTPGNAGDAEDASIAEELTDDLLAERRSEGA